MKKINLLLIIICLLVSYFSTAQICFSPVISTSVSVNDFTNADFNGDGRMDIATCYSDKISILLGNGSGEFQSTPLIYIFGVNIASILSADFNEDGKMDLASLASGHITIFLGTGLGSFSDGERFLNESDNSNEIVSSDYNGDGHLDLAIANYGSGSVSIMLGNGLGDFSAPTKFAVVVNPVTIASADFNGDGKIDLAVGSAFLASMSVLFGDGLGSFSTPTNFNVPTGTASNVISDDFNNDGKKDLVVASQTVFSIMLGNGSGGFTTMPNKSVMDPRFVLSSDFNGDGKKDLAISSQSINKVSIFLGDGFGDFSSNYSFDVGTKPASLISADFNGDGRMDIASGNIVSNTVSVLLGLINVNISQTNVNCKGAATGSATASVSCGLAPYSYIWDTLPIQKSAIASGLSAGTYTVTATDASNATQTAKVTITELPAISATYSTIPNTKCSGACDGTITINATGGTAPYIYKWDANANNQITKTATGLCSGKYTVVITDANSCTFNKEVVLTSTSNFNVQVYLTNIAAVDQVNVSPSFTSYYSYSLPSIITPNPANPRNFVDPGKKARFKVECTNKKANGLSIVSGVCKVTSNCPHITITDSNSALNNIGWNNKAWSADEFEIEIAPNTPPGTIAYIDFIVQENGVDYSTTCIPIPITPLVYSPTTSATIDDDNNPDSNGNDNDICEPNEIIEFYPWLDNISTLNAQYVRGRFENLDNLSYINIWNNHPGVGTTVFDTSWWNFAFAQPTIINSNTINTTPEYDFVFNYNNSNTVNNFKLYMVMAGGFKLFPGAALSLVQWSLPYTFNAGTLSSSDFLQNDNLIIYPNPATNFINVKVNPYLIGSRFTITDILGKIVLGGKLLNETSSINIEQFSKGMYFFKIGGQSQETFKIIKE